MESTDNDLRQLVAQLQDRLNHLDQRRERILRLLCTNEAAIQTVENNLVDLAGLLDAPAQQKNE